MGDYDVGRWVSRVILDPVDVLPLGGWIRVRETAFAEIAVSQRAVKGFEHGRFVGGHGWADAEERRHCWIMYMLCRWALNW